MPSSRTAHFAALAGLAALAGVLQGCGGGGGTPTPAPTPTTAAPTPTPTAPTPAPPPTPTPPTPGFHLNPIEVNGQHLYDSVTKEPFHAVGIAFPNKMANDPKDWIKVLERIGQLGKVNLIRLYEVPPCIWDDAKGSCFAEFMKVADKLGMYIILPGTGAVSGYIPRDECAKTMTGQECYQAGKPLDMGRGIIQRFSYPNTFAIMVGNEFFLGKSTFRAAAVFKAYARDLKAYMKTCNEDEGSPGKATTRQIPIMYAARDLGDAVVREVMSFFQCGSANISIDIFGLNVERWCDPKTTDGYDTIHKVVTDANLPGSFLFSEMGCPQNLVSHAPEGQECRKLPGLGNCCPRNWNQVPNFFTKYTMFDGFSAYAYWNDGALNFNMLSSKDGDAELYDDGMNFFNQTSRVQKAPRPVKQVKHPTCATQIQGVDLLLLDDIQPYNQEAYPVTSCPDNKHPSESSFVV